MIGSTYWTKTPNRLNYLNCFLADSVDWSGFVALPCFHLSSFHDPESSLETTVTTYFGDVIRVSLHSWYDWLPNWHKTMSRQYWVNDT